jgi:hypothetical protein
MPGNRILFSKNITVNLRMSNINSNTSATPRPYRFKLNSSKGLYICERDPIGCNDSTFKLTRDIKAGGITNSFIVGQLVFIGGAATYLRELFESDECNAECTLTVGRFKRTTWSYVDYPEAYSIDFKDWEIVAVGNFHFGVKVGLINSSMLSLFDERKKVKLDLTRRKTLGGMEIADFADFPKTSKLKIPAINSSYLGKWISNGNYHIDRIEEGETPYTDYSFTQIPLTVSSSDLATSSNVSYYTKRATEGDVYPFYTNSGTAEKTVSMYWNIKVDVTNGSGNLASGENVYTLKYAIYNGNTFVSNYVMYYSDEGETEGWGNNEGERILYGTKSDIVLQAGESIRLYIRVKSDFNFRVWDAYLKSAIVTITESVAATAETTIEGMPILHALTRSAQLMLEEQYPVYSVFFGLTDSTYDGTNNYSIESNERTALLASGLNVRGLPIAETNGGRGISFEDLIESINSIWCVGYGFVNNKLRIENYSWFFQNTLILDLSDRVSKYDIKTQYMGEMAYIEIENGYESYEYKSTNGRAEYNTKTSRTTSLKAMEKLELVSKLRADTMGIIQAISKPINTTGTEDLDSDEHVFIIKAQREPDTEAENGWVAETNELIEVLDDSSLFKASSLNLFITPIRNLLRNAVRISPALQKMTSSFLRFQTTNKLQTLKTKGIYESVDDALTENQDIRVADLGAPLFRPIKHTVEVMISDTEIQAVLANPYGYIKVSDTISGYLLVMEKKTGEDKVMIELIEKI